MYDPVIADLRSGVHVYTNKLVDYNGHIHVQYIYGCVRITL